MIFLIQTHKGRVVDDFAFALMASVDFYKWKDKNTSLKYILVDTIPKLDAAKISDIVPVGSIEFVDRYVNLYYGLSLSPINIPPELMIPRFSGRGIEICHTAHITSKNFVKSMTKLKGLTTICENSQIPKDVYQVSDVVSFESEYRAFVYKTELQGLQWYSGDFTLFPDVGTIKEMIVCYTQAPIAYTLDVGIMSGKTVIIECHDFYSCGLYGFSNYKILPYMFSQWFFEYLRKNKQ